MKLYILFTSRIGHLAANTELFLRRQSVGMVEGALVRLIDHPSGNTIANMQLYKMINRRHKVFEITTATFITLIEQGHENGGELPLQSNEHWEFNNIKPQLSFTNDEVEKGRDLLNYLGIKDRPFVCMHNRSKDYLDNIDKNTDWSYHNYRDCNINNYMFAAEWLTSQGIFVIRLGQVAPDRMSTDNPMIIDFTNEKRSDFGDVYLAANCLFFLGNTAGIYLVSSIFGINSACANFVPFNVPPWLSGDLFIYKNLNLPFSKQINLDFSDLESNLISVDENSPEQILKLAMEMAFRKSKSYIENPRVRELRLKFRSLWNRQIRGHGFLSDIGDQFILEKQNLVY